MRLTVARQHDRARIYVEGVIDEQSAEDLKQRFFDMNGSLLSELVLDFSEMSQIGSAGIGKILVFHQDLAAHGGVIRIENVSESVYELFHMLKLDTLFAVEKKKD